ncbi:MAG: LPS-assembly protein LptD [Acidobacteriota bacterium]|nr:LPS-assembly protein LptD [Acidobacteriota bacterium]
MKGRGQRINLGLPLFVLLLGVALPAVRAGAQTKRKAGQAAIELGADQQRWVGPMYYADGNVVARYGAVTLHADHVEYNSKTQQINLRGHVRFDYQNQTIQGTEGAYNLSTGLGSFEKVYGTIRAIRPPNPSLLVSPNPLTFSARRIERINDDTYVIHQAWLTVCDQRKPSWKFYTGRAVVHINRSVKLYGANFRMFSIPLLYLPYATLPAGKNLRQSGFLIPDIGESSIKGFVAGESYYWAPTDWFDMTLGGQYYSKIGWSQIGNLRGRPARNINFSADYFGVIDRNAPNQGGYNADETFDALFGSGWRMAASLNQLSSMTFRQAFAGTYYQAVNPEVRSSAFVTNNFNGYSLDFAALNYKNFLTLSPEEFVVSRQAPEARFSSTDRALLQKLPLYFSFDMFADAAHRNESNSPQSDTGPAVQRTEVAPSLTMPLRWGPWLGITPTFVVRETHYGAQQTPTGAILNTGLNRTTEEVTVDLRPPAFAREWGGQSSRWEHAIEPQIVYRDVNGVDNFPKFIPFDQDETLTDTNEIEYSITQRLFHRSGKGSDDADSQLLSWQLAQKYYFDPTFGGALFPGQRNMFQAIDSLTPFAYADRARQFSPVISDLRITPGGPWDVQFRQDIDPVLGKVTASGALVKIRPWREMFLTLAHFDINTDPVLQQPSNQIQVLAGYGDLNRQGWNASFGLSYNAQQNLFQNQVAEISYNGSCCGLAFEYRRLALGPLRTENQFRIALLIANIGTFGNIARREKIF